jgi:Tfp pilus assembly protein PilN
MTLPPYEGPRPRPAGDGVAPLAGTATAWQGGESVSPPDVDALGRQAAPAMGLGGVPLGGLPTGGAVVAPLADDERQSLNLASRPFINTRPVVRVAVILWALGVLLLTANVVLFVGYLNSSRETRAKLAQMREQVEVQRGSIARLDTRIGTLNLEQQNRMALFLNHVIAERTFSWSLLFDRLAQVLPDGVRLLHLTPSNVVQKDFDAALRAGREQRRQPVVLAMSCEAKNDEALLRFVDNLFAHPAFAEPNLLSESQMDNGLVKFDLNVQYQPASPLAAAAMPGAAGAGNAKAKAKRQAAGVAGGDSADGAATPDADAPLLPPTTRPVSPAGAGLVRVAPPGSKSFAPTPSTPTARRPAGIPPPAPPGGRR